MNLRENNFDCLRLYAMLLVIINHACDMSLSFDYPNIYIYIYELISHVGVPLFLMLTGAFVLKKEILNLRLFYINVFIKLGMPTLLFTFYYLIYDYYEIKSIESIINAVYKGFLTLNPLWYMYMLIGIYFIIPLISIIRHQLSFKQYIIFSAIFFVWSRFSYIADTYNSSYSIGCSLSFLGYVLLGDIIKEIITKKSKNNIKSALIFIGANSLLIIDGILLYMKVLSGGNYYCPLLNMYSAPLIAISSVLIFYAFGIANININVNSLSRLSFYVFLSQRLFFNLYKELFNNLKLIIGNVSFLVFVETLVILLSCLIISFIFDKVYNNVVILVRRKINEFKRKMSNY